MQNLKRNTGNLLPTSPEPLLKRRQIHFADAEGCYEYTCAMELFYKVGKATPSSTEEARQVLEEVRMACTVLGIHPRDMHEFPDYEMIYLVHHVLKLDTNELHQDVLRTLRVLVVHGATIAWADNHGTPILTSCQTGDTAKTLIQAGVDDFACTPLPNRYPCWQCSFCALLKQLGDWIYDGDENTLEVINVVIAHQSTSMVHYYGSCRKELTALQCVALCGMSSWFTGRVDNLVPVVLSLLNAGHSLNASTTVDQYTIGSALLNNAHDKAVQQDVQFVLYAPEILGWEYHALRLLVCVRKVMILKQIAHTHRFNWKGPQLHKEPFYMEMALALWKQEEPFVQATRWCCFAGTREYLFVDTDVYHVINWAIDEKNYTKSKEEYLEYARIPLQSSLREETNEGSFSAIWRFVCKGKAATARCCPRGR